tara:strand:- start:1453 stop:1590 length:138 start_codon:yes stop_codon:yes gene_type:complete
MDSLRITGQSVASMGLLYFEVIPWVLAVIVGVLQVVYLVKKIKEK